MTHEDDNGSAPGKKSGGFRRQSRHFCRIMIEVFKTVCGDNPGSTSESTSVWRPKQSASFRAVSLDNRQSWKIFSRCDWFHSLGHDRIGLDKHHNSTWTCVRNLGNKRSKRKKNIQSFLWGFLVHCTVYNYLSSPQRRFICKARMNCDHSTAAGPRSSLLILTQHIDS